MNLRQEIESELTRLYQEEREILEDAGAVYFEDIPITDTETINLYGETAAQINKVRKLLHQLESLENDFTKLNN